jgi:macrophage erythroblast attacher
MTEAYLLSTPVSALRESFKVTQKLIDAELKQCVSHIQRLKAVASSEQGTRGETAAELNALRNTLQQLRAQLVAARLADASQCDALRRRIEYVVRATTVASVASSSSSSSSSVSSSSVSAVENSAAASQVVLDRLVVDFLLRSGHAETARHLAQQANVTALCDFAMFDQVHAVLASLRRRDCAPALQWCAAHRAQLSKLPADVDVEFDLRAHEFLALIRIDQRKQALAYARQWFPAHAERQLPALQRTMACLAFDSDTQHPRYRALFDETTRLAELARRFFRAALAVAGAPAIAPLLVYTTAALATLKTTACTIDSERVAACPACNDPLRGLAVALPVALRQQSFLLCRISGSVMGDDDPPLALPNGNVYSTSALKAQASANGGRVRDPRSGEVFTLDDCVKLHVL